MYLKEYLKDIRYEINPTYECDICHMETKKEDLVKYRVNNKKAIMCKACESAYIRMCKSKGMKAEKEEPQNKNFSF